jgi:hypothetical protein
VALLWATLGETVGWWGFSSSGCRAVQSQRLLGESPVLCWEGETFLADIAVVIETFQKREVIFRYGQVPLRSLVQERQVSEA